MDNEKVRKRQRERWTAERARSALEELSRGTQSIAAFAAQNGISPQRLVYWKKRLRDSAKKGPAFVRVALPSKSASQRPSTIEIQVGSVVLRVSEDVNTNCVARLVHALERPQRAC